MIVAGNQIEAHFGVMFNCSVMFCAALGIALYAKTIPPTRVER